MPAERRKRSSQRGHFRFITDAGPGTRDLKEVRIDSEATVLRGIRVTVAVKCALYRLSTSVGGHLKLISD